MTIDSTSTTATATFAAVPAIHEATPVVFERDGVVFANSLDVAACFGKRHDNVLRDIDNLLKNNTSSDLRGWFVPSLHQGPQGQKYRAFDMTRDGFTLLAMGFTGPKALEFKLRYIEQFNAMEAELRRQAGAPKIDWNNPTDLKRFLIGQLERQEQLEAENAALISTVAEQEPKVIALERLAGAEGLFGVRESAALLHMRQSDFTAHIEFKLRWVYRIGRSKRLQGYAVQSKLGYLRSVPKTIQTASGEDKAINELMFTPKGLTVIARGLGKTLELP